MATGNFFVDKTRTVTLEHLYQGLEKPDATEFKANSLIWDRQLKGWFTNPSGAWVAATFSGSQFALSDLTNVATAGAIEGQGLVYDAAVGEWIPGTVTAELGDLEELANVSTSSPSDGQVLTFDAATSKWGGATLEAGSGSSTLGGLTDVTIVSPTDNDILYYQASTSTWRRQPFSTQETYSSASDVMTVVRPYIDSIDGGAGFTDVSGTVTLDLSSARAFHYTMTGNISSLSLSSTPNGVLYETAFTLVLKVDATGGYTLSTPFSVTWLDGSSWSDLDLTANAVNIVQFVNVGNTVYGALVYKDGAIKLDPYVLSFADNGDQLIVITQAETIDLGNVSNVEADGTAGTGTLSFQKNGSAATGSTGFTSGDVLKVTLASSTTPTAVSIPRLLG